MKKITTKKILASIICMALIIGILPMNVSAFVTDPKAKLIRANEETSYFNTLAEAINAAEDGDTVVLVSEAHNEYCESTGMTITKNITFKTGKIEHINQQMLLSFSGSDQPLFTIKSGGKLTIQNSEFKFVDSEITGNGKLIVVDAGGTLVLDGTDTEPVIFSNSVAGLILVKNGGKIIFNGATFTGSSYNDDIKNEDGGYVISDLNGDHVINFCDLVLAQKHLESPETTPLTNSFDYDLNGNINLADYDILENHLVSTNKISGNEQSLLLGTNNISTTTGKIFAKFTPIINGTYFFAASSNESSLIISALYSCDEDNNLVPIKSDNSPIYSINNAEGTAPSYNLVADKDYYLEFGAVDISGNLCNGPFVISVGCESIHTIVNSKDSLILPGGWYIVPGDVKVDENITFTGNANIIIANGVHFEVQYGIVGTNGANLTFYSQTDDFDEMGVVDVIKAYSGNAGIGSARQGTCGDITINGGTFHIQGGLNAAGIGCGADGNCGTITINGGKVFAIAGDSSAGIGSGSSMDDYGSICEGVVINGGVAVGVGKDDAQNIGAGKNMQPVNVEFAENMYVIYDPHFTSVNIEIYSQTEPSCIAGHKAYIKNRISGKCYTSETLEPNTLIADIDQWLAPGGEGYNGAGDGVHKDTDKDGYCDGCGTFAQTDVNCFIFSNTDTPSLTVTCKADKKLIEQIDSSVISKVKFMFGGTRAISGYMYSNGNFVQEYDLVPFGIESMNIYAVLVYETDPNCWLAGHKMYYENTQDGYFYQDQFCSTCIGDADDLNEWLSTAVTNGGGMIPALGHIDENSDGKCDRCEETLVETYPETASTCETTGHKAYYRKIADGYYYEDVGCTKKIGIYEQLQTWLSSEGRLPLAEHRDTNGDGACDTCGKVLTKYYVFNEDSKEFELKGQNPVTQILASSDNLSLTDGWYLIDGTVKVNNRITVSGNVHLILANYSELVAKQGIGIANYGSLTVYAETLDITKMGKIAIESAPVNCAGIGCGEYGDCKKITVNGGVIEVTGSKDAAGIGSGLNGSCTGITINGGALKVIGGENGAGIGSGNNGRCSGITINGGLIKATGGKDAAQNIGKGNSSNEVTVTYKGGVVHTNNGGSEWVNLEYIAGHENTCTIAGAKDAYKNLLDENYYVTFPFTSTDLIGNETAFESWLSTAVTNGGGMIPATGHIDADSNNICDRCGETMDSDKPTYTDASLTLDSNIFLNFYLNLTDDAVLNGTMTFDIGGRIVTGVTAKYNLTVNKYYFACPITALEMAETVTATFSYNGEDYIQTYSVEDYIEEIIGNEEKYGDKAAALAHKIANYGHYAQIYLASIHTNVTIGQNGYAEIARSKKYNINVGTATTALNANSLTVAGATDALNLYGTTVYFDSATALNYYVKATGVTQPTATAVNLVTEKNKTVEIKHYKDDIYIVSVKDIIATELADNIAVTVNGGLTITGSVFAYCKAVMNKEGQTESAKNAMAAFYEYHVAACGYHNTLN